MLFSLLLQDLAGQVLPYAILKESFTGSSGTPGLRGS
jgi:hypothetical protein